MVNLNQYMDLVDTEATISVLLNAHEQAAILAAYDYGAKNLSGVALESLNSALAKLKDSIWP